MSFSGEATVHPEGVLRFGGRQWRCALGRAGVRPHKQEGDGATPSGLLPLRRVLYRADRLPVPDTGAAVEPIAPSDGWCDDPADAHYNEAVTLPYQGRHEALWRNDGLYDLVGVLGWNDEPVRLGGGSAVFLHVARPDYAPTDGCVALALADLTVLLATGLTALRVLVPG